MRHHCSNALQLPAPGRVERVQASRLILPFSQLWDIPWTFHKHNEEFQH